MSQKPVLSVFTKPWLGMSVSELGRHVSGLGFDGVQFPVRSGYQVEPENVETGLPVLARQLGDYGLKITSVAGPTTEAGFAGCAAAGVPIIHIVYNLVEGGYMVSEKRAQDELDKLIPLCERYGVKVGVQNHAGGYVPINAMGILHLIERYDPRHVGAIWDAMHNALDGEEPEIGLDIVWSRLCMVNLKNAYWRRSSGTEAENVEWQVYHTIGRQGLASWPRVASYLKQRDYQGVVCLSAEYEAYREVDRLIAEDLAFAKSLF